MKRKVSSRISMFLVLVMLFGLLPLTAFAANDEMVLTSISHTSAVGGADATGTNTATLMVPSTYTGTVDLSHGLSLSYNTAAFSSVSARFPSGSVATVGGDPVAMVVSYLKENDATVYTTNYSIRVIRAFLAPTFTGTIAKTVTLPGILTLPAADFTGKYTKNDDTALASVAITGTNPTFGTLKLGNQAYVSGEAISLADLEAGKLTFVATGEGTVSYDVKAYALGDTQTAIGSVLLTITVQRSTNGGTVTYSTDKNVPVKLASVDFANAFSTASGEALASVKFTLPSATAGKLYYNYRSANDYDAIVFADTQYAKDTLSNITFVPAANFIGTVTVAYAGYNAAGAALPGSLVINVDNDAAADITYTTAKNTPVALTSTPFINAFTAPNGGTLANVKFTLPSATVGKLYYNYRATGDYDAVVLADTQYGAALLNNITFVPAADYTGIATIAYNGFNAAGAALPGKLVITVGNAGTTANTISYTTVKDKALSFNAADFNNISKAVTGKDLSYVMFTLPSTTFGKLYYNYISETEYDGLVASDIGYIKNSNPYLSYVDFVPAAGYIGTSTITYTGYNTQGTSFTGEVKITVTATDEEEDEDHFKDVGKNYAWALDAINYLYENKIILGDKKGFYNPNASVSRGDFILMLCRAFDLKADRSGNFSDVEEGSYYYDAIATAKSLKIVKGDGGKFNPRSALSRQDAMVLIARALEASGITIAAGDATDLQSFSDSDKIDSYAKGSVSTFVKAKIIKGNDKKISPKSSISRAEIAVILHRILTK